MSLGGRNFDSLFSHIVSSLSDHERKIANRRNQAERGTLVNLKQTISILFSRYCDLTRTGVRQDVFALCFPKARGCYALIFVNDICIDIGSNTFVLDACFFPINKSTVTDSIQKFILRPEFEPNGIITPDDEACGWMLFAVVLAERCRTWKHRESCEYLMVGIRAVENDVLLCSCGKGKNLGKFGEKKEYKVFHAETTRIAIGPLFPFSYAEKTNASELMDGYFPNGSVSSSYSSSSHMVPDICVNCGEAGQPTLQCCSGCKTTKYCSPACQNVDWKIHKKRCKH